MTEEELIQALEKYQVRIDKALESRIRMLMRKYVCYQHCGMKKGECCYSTNSDEHICNFSGFSMNIYEEVDKND